MNNRTALRLAKSAENHVYKARTYLRRIVDEHPLGKVMWAAFDNQQDGMPIDVNWEEIVQAVLSMAAMIELAQSKEGD